jgi:hypothetical protein
LCLHEPVARESEFRNDHKKSGGNIAQNVKTRTHLKSFFNL